MMMVMLTTCHFHKPIATPTRWCCYSHTTALGELLFYLLEFISSSIGRERAHHSLSKHIHYQGSPSLASKIATNFYTTVVSQLPVDRAFYWGHAVVRIDERGSFSSVRTYPKHNFDPVAVWSSDCHTSLCAPQTCRKRRPVAPRVSSSFFLETRSPSRTIDYFHRLKPNVVVISSSTGR